MGSQWCCDRNSGSNPAPPPCGSSLIFPFCNNVGTAHEIWEFLDFLIIVLSYWFPSILLLWQLIEKTEVLIFEIRRFTCSIIFLDLRQVLSDWSDLLLKVFLWWLVDYLSWSLLGGRSQTASRLAPNPALPSWPKLFISNSVDRRCYWEGCTSRKYLRSHYYLIDGYAWAMDEENELTICWLMKRRPMWKPNPINLPPNISNHN